MCFTGTSWSGQLIFLLQSDSFSKHQMSVIGPPTCQSWGLAWRKRLRILCDQRPQWTFIFLLQHQKVSDKLPWLCPGASQLFCWNTGIRMIQRAQGKETCSLKKSDWTETGRRNRVWTSRVWTSLSEDYPHIPCLALRLPQSQSSKFLQY